MMKRTEAIRKIKNETQGKIERKIPLKNLEVVIRDETRIVNALKQERGNNETKGGTNENNVTKLYGGHVKANYEY